MLLFHSSFYTGFFIQKEKKQHKKKQQKVFDNLLDNKFAGNVWRYFDRRYLIQSNSQQRTRDICVGGFSYHPGARVPFEKSGSISRFSHGETVNACIPSHSQECIRAFVLLREDSRLRYCAHAKRDGNAAMRRDINSRLSKRFHRDDRDIAIETSLV